ncbi:MAG: SURF1 family cytochrome oxidase biogenesis protein, partial [Betaproteobacteria bacterium]
MLSKARWVVLVAAVLTAGVTARLGVWQLDRAAQKTAVQASLDARRDLPELSPTELPGEAQALADLLHRRIRLQGVWLPEHTVY